MRNKLCLAFLTILILSSAAVNACECETLFNKNDTITRLKAFLKNKPTTNINDVTCSRGGNIYYAAISKGDLVAVKYLVEAGCDVNLNADRQRTTPLGKAAKNCKKTEVAEFLIKSGADVNYGSDKGRRTILFNAINYNNFEMVHCLLKNGAKPFVGYEGDACMSNRHLLILREMLKYSAKENKYSAIGTAASGTYEELLSKLKTDNDIKHFRGPAKLSLLHVAALNGNTELVKKLLPIINYKTQTNKQLRAIHCAAAAGHDDIINILLEAGESADFMDANGVTPIIMAARGNHPSTIKLLAENDASLNTMDYFKCRTPLHWAAYFAADEALAVLIELGADVNAKGSSLETPLFIAVDRSDDIDTSNAVKILLAAKVNLKATTWDGMDILEHANMYATRDTYSVIQTALRKKGLLKKTSYKRSWFGRNKPTSKKVLPISGLEAVNRAKPNVKTVVLVPIGKPSAKMLREMAKNIKHVLKVPVLIDAEGITREDLKEADYRKTPLEDDRIILEVMKRVGKNRPNIAITCVTNEDLLSNGNWRFSCGHTNVFISSYYRLGGKYKPVVCERFLKQLVAKTTAVFGMERCYDNRTTCPRSSPRSLRALDNFNFDMCDICVEKFRRVFGYTPGKIEKEPLPVEDDEVF